MNARVRRLGALASLALLVQLVALWVLPGVAPATVPDADAAAACAASHAPGAGDGYNVTEPLTRSYYDANGAATDQNCFKVSVNKHTNLLNHERITVTWSGAHPSENRAVNPFGESGLSQGYPVLLMECRGVDTNNGVPAGAEAVSPSTCWTSTSFQRSNSAQPGQGIWEQDASSGDDTSHIQGIDPATKFPASCNVNGQSDYWFTPYKALGGKVYPACDSQSMPPEATVNSVTIPNEVYAYTSADGTGTFPFEVRTALENRSLGCTDNVPCTLEVIPMYGVNCDNTDPAALCNATGGQPGAAPDAVSGSYWFTASNWDRRVSIPLDFTPPPSACTVAGAGKPVPFYGSELLAQTALQWIPSYCLNKQRFNWQSYSLPDDAAFGLMQSGGAAAAEVSKRGANDKGIGYAPTAATGWGIAFNIDKPNNGGQQQTLNLNAMLLAKLLTESYPGSTGIYANRPDLAHNPLSLNMDPEFQALNPGLDASHWSEAAATLLVSSTSSQAMYQLTSYIASDPQAMAFIHGKAQDEGGYSVHVNRYYKDLKLPVDSWPLLDSWQYKTSTNACLTAQGDSMPPYLPLLANPVPAMDQVAQAMLYNWPNVETACTGVGTSQSPYQLARVAPQGVGNRFMLGVVTLGDAARYGLTVANLQAAPGHYVAPDSAGMKAALALAKPTSRTRPFELTQASMRTSATAYPGTMLVYTAAKTYGLDTSTAKDVSQFMRISSTQGQVPGRGNGQLAAGYLPLVDAGVTKGLYRQARTVAAAVAAQKAPVVKAPKPTPTPTPPTPPGVTVGGSVPPPVDQGVPPAGPSTPASTSPAPHVTEAAPAGPAYRTTSFSPGASGSLLTVLLVIGVLSGILTTGVRLALRFKGLR